MNGIEDAVQSCKICGYECKNRKSLGMHLARSHNTDSKSYYDLHLKSQTALCSCGCGTETLWHKTLYRYNDFITGHNPAGFRVKQPEMTPERRAQIRKTAAETYKQRGAEIRKKISDGVKAAFENEDTRTRHSDAIKAYWAIPENKKRLCELRQRVWDEQHDELVEKIFTPEFGAKISKANSERDMKRTSEGEKKFGEFLSSLFGHESVKSSKWIKIGDRYKCFDFELTVSGCSYLIEYDGSYWHGLNKEQKWSRPQLWNIAADQVKNAHCAANDLKLIRISEAADLTSVTDIASLISVAYHYSDGHNTIKSRSRPFSAGVLFSKEESQSTPDEIKESVVLPALMSLCADEIELHGDTWLSRYEKSESLTDSLVSLSADDLSFNSSAGSSFLRKAVPSYWRTAGGFNEASCDLKSLESVLRYRLGLGATREIFDITPEEIKRGFIVQKHAPSWFKPAWAVHIWRELVGEITCPTVWDPSGGWGARMLAFKAAYSHGTYHCTEPATETYRDLVGLHETLWPGGCPHVYHRGSEHSHPEIDDESCDAIFTSPPYFNRERWWNESGQCWKDYPTLNSWESEYVIPTVVTALMKLKHGGLFAINTTPEFAIHWLSVARAVGFKFLYERELSANSDHFQRSRGVSKRKNREMLYVWTRITLFNLCTQ